MPVIHLCFHCKEPLDPVHQPTRPGMLKGAIAVRCDCGTWTLIPEEEETPLWGLHKTVAAVEERVR